MSEPTSDRNDQTPVKLTGKAVPLTPAPPQEFDLLAFWIQYRSTVMKVITFTLLAVAGWAVWQVLEMRKRAGSEGALASAKTEDALRKVIADWAGTPSSGSAQILLGAQLREAGKFDDSAKVLKEFADKNGSHPLQVGALFSLGTTLEFAGKMDEAAATYQSIISGHPASAFAPQAMLGQARIFKGQDKADEIRRVLGALQQQFANSPYEKEATGILEALNNPKGRMTGGSPRPAPPAPPAPVPVAPGAPKAVVTPGAPPITITPTPETPKAVVPQSAPPITITPAPAAPVPEAPKPTEPAPAPAPAK